MAARSAPECITVLLISRQEKESARRKKSKFDFFSPENEIWEQIASEYVFQIFECV